MAERLPSSPPVLAGFSYIRPLGAGGFADVFLYEQQRPRRQVAVKVLLTSVVNKKVLALFEAEADTMAKLSTHPLVATIYEAGISGDGRPYLVMEYCPDSYALSYRQKPFSVAHVLKTAIGIGSALESAHRAGVLHRDIKPANILITEYGVAVLSDFGIAASLTKPDADEQVMMSVPWSAPEVIAEETTGTVQSEVWAFGATVYSLLAAHSPFEMPGKGQNTKEKLKTRIKKAKYIPTGRQDVPERLEKALQKALSRIPAERYQSINEFLQELQLIETQLGFGPTNIEVAKLGADFSPTKNIETTLSPITHVALDSSRKTRSQPNFVRPHEHFIDDEREDNIAKRKLIKTVALTAIITAASLLGILYLVDLI